MRRFVILAVAVVALGLVMRALPALAQDILGLSLRPTGEVPAGTARGTADIVVADGGGYLVSVDLSAAGDSLALEDFSGAEAFVVWAVDMDGVPHNLGTLGADNTLEDRPVDFNVARLLVTAEESADAANPGEPLFQATLREVALQEAAAEPTATPAAEPTAVAEEAAEDGNGPENLPTTGDPLRDLAVLAMVAAGLLAGGLRLRLVRL
jgi:hypothetical protein